MAVIESLNGGLHLLEVVAEAGQPMSMSALIEKCGTDMAMSEASVRNTVETLVWREWLRKYSGKGTALEYGLGERAAKLWPIYLGRKLDLVEQQNREQATEIVRLRKMAEV